MTQFFLLKETNVSCLLLVEVETPLKGQIGVILSFEKDPCGTLKHVASYAARQGKNFAFVDQPVVQQALTMAGAAIKAAARGAKNAVRRVGGRPKAKESSTRQLSLAI